MNCVYCNRKLDKLNDCDTHYCKSCYATFIYNFELTKSDKPELEITLLNSMRYENMWVEIYHSQNISYIISVIDTKQHNFRFDYIMDVTPTTVDDFIERFDNLKAFL